MATLKEISHRKTLLTGGHRLCAGCGAPIIVRQLLYAAKRPVVATCATSCLEVSTTPYPFTAWKTSYIHSAFENAAATISGIESAHKVLKRKGKIKDDFEFVAFGGDGGTYDIGIQALSGAIERGHNITYICYNNEAYMNTGTQRSSATPLGAWSSTTPAGKIIPGKPQMRKDLTQIVAAHDIGYAAQASPSHWKDLISKAEKAFEMDGPAFLNILSPCPRGWRYPSEKTISIAKLGVETLLWPLYEVEEGKYRINYKPKETKPVEEWLKSQGRFRHLFAPGNEKIIEAIQKEVDEKWENLLLRCE